MSSYDRKQIFRLTEPGTLRYSPSLARELRALLHVLPTPRPDARDASILLLQLEFNAALHGKLDENARHLTLSCSLADLQTQTDFPRTNIKRILEGLAKLHLLTWNTKAHTITLHLHALNALQSLQQRQTVPPAPSQKADAHNPTESHDAAETPDAPTQPKAAKNTPEHSTSDDAFCATEERPESALPRVTVEHPLCHSGTPPFHGGTNLCHSGTPTYITYPRAQLESEKPLRENVESTRARDDENRDGMLHEAGVATPPLAAAPLAAQQEAQTNTYPGALSTQERDLMLALMQNVGNDLMRFRMGTMHGMRTADYKNCARYLVEIAAQQAHITQFFAAWPFWKCRHNGRHPHDIDPPTPTQISQHWESVLQFAATLQRLDPNLENAWELYRHESDRATPRYRTAAEKNRDNLAVLLSGSDALRSCLADMGHAANDAQSLSAPQPVMGAARH